MDQKVLGVKRPKDLVSLLPVANYILYKLLNCFPKIEVYMNSKVPLHLYNSKVKYLKTL